MMSSESDSVSPPLTVEKCSLVLVDVAGTTTSIDFVKDTLFPFAVERAEAFLSSKWEEEAVKECVAKIRDGDQELDAVAAAARVKTLTEKDSSNEGLKTLQGLIYKEGYEKGDLKAHVFDDVAAAFETWAKTRRVAVYSTGSVDAQKLLFAHTIAGDLSAHISNYFDQSVGAKTEADSYKKIAEETKTPPEEVVFVTDDIKEAAAAKAGGVHAVLIKREGNPALPEEAVKEFAVVASFAELALDKTGKRKVEEEEAANVEAPPSKVPKTDAEGKAAKDDSAAAEKVEQEPMEVDAAEEAKVATEETENLVKNAPEKTESDGKEAKDAEMKEVEEKKVQPEVVGEIESAKEETKVVEEAKGTVEEAKSTTEAVKEKEEDAQSTEDKDTVKAEAKPAAEETKPSADNLEPIAEEPEAQVEEETEKKEEAQPSTEKAPETATDEGKEAQSSVEEATKAADKETVAEKAQAQKKEDTQLEKTEEAKPDEAKAEEEEGAAKNGEEEAETSAPKAEEKENKSVLANGVENGNKDESEVDNATDEKESETAEVTNDDDVDNKDDDNEVKVKKLEESAESKTVSVEV